jgi:polyisoprenoid-binding protein YceI
MISAFIVSLFLFIGCDDPTAGAPVAEVKPAAEAPAEPAAPAADADPAADAAGALKGDNTTGSIGFIGTKVTGSHEGNFQTFTVSGAVADGQLTAIEGSIDMASTDSDAEKLTSHLKSADFFDVEQFTTATFKSNSISAGEDGSHMVTGTLDFHGVQKEITFPATITVAEGSASLKAEFAMNRKDFSVEYPGRPDDLIKDDVLIKLDFNLKG